MSTLRILSEREHVALVAEDYKRKPVIELPQGNSVGPLDYFSDSLNIIPEELRLNYLVYCQRRMYDLFIREHSRIAAIEQSTITFAKQRLERVVHHDTFETERGEERFRYIVNSKWVNYPRWIILESLQAEVIETYEELRTKNNSGNRLALNDYANKRFITAANRTGLHLQQGTGHHLQPGNGLFAALMEDLQVPAPPSAIVPDRDKKHNWWDKVHGRMKGTSALLLYTAPNCERPAICKVRGGKDDLNIACLTCGSKFIPQI